MNIEYKGNWVCVYLCSQCGEYLSADVTVTHWGKPCHRCGQVGVYCPDAIQTSRRFICTQKRIFRSDIGYYEWSGKDASNNEIPGKLMNGRKIINPTITIAAAGVASGLF